MTTSRAYTGVGWNLERRERSASSGMSFAEHDSMDRYSKRLTRDLVNRITKVEFRDFAADDEDDLELDWVAPTATDWSRGSGTGGTVKYDEYGRRFQIRIDNPDGGADLVKPTVTDGSGNLLCDGDWVQTTAARPACDGAMYRDYDGLGRPARIRRGGTEQINFDYDGLKTTEHRRVFTGSGPTEEIVDVIFQRDGFGRLVKVIEPAPTGASRSRNQRPRRS